ncbi:hypothetical protein [Metabacillus halosaccharovorans]|uniref:hypothetical protein n=1 Tax=Metabacillus halosaccharovorans TaxID=930124 RepID=UPI001C1F424C|nr:hypothetical protein [Metabacillus halosaccharovorans]MBU7594691.1 hypothetical protein [Metabacillus halosaccharovorans]
MKKALITILALFILGVGVFFGYEYVTEPKMVDGVVSKNIDDKGNPIDVTTTFSPEDTIYFSAKRNRFWIKEAQIVWYKGEIKTENRFLVEKEVGVNKAGYFSTKLSVPEGLEEGHYGVTIYVKGKEIMETKAEFDVEK